MHLTMLLSSLPVFSFPSLTQVVSDEKLTPWERLPILDAKDQQTSSTNFNNLIGQIRSHSLMYKCNRQRSNYAMIIRSIAMCLRSSKL